MGRAKLNMELISKEKPRNVTFKKRKEGLIRKLQEFTTLCDVSACMIIYGPKQENGAVEADIWPKNMDEINRLVGIYKAKKKDSSNKAYSLSDFFHDRKRKIEEELSKLRKSNMEARYPTWLDLLNFMTESQLREFSASLSNKAEHVKSRIELLRRNQQGFGLNLIDFTRAGLNQAHGFYTPGMMRAIELELINHEQAIELPHVPFNHNQDMHCMNQNNPMMMLLMNDADHFLQYGGASTTGNFQSASFKRQVLYEPRVGGCGLVDPAMYHEAKPFPQYYMPPPPPPPPHVRYDVMQGAVPPLLPVRENHDGGQEDVVQYHTTNHRARY